MMRLDFHRPEEVEKKGDDKQRHRNTAYGEDAPSGAHGKRKKQGRSMGEGFGGKTVVKRRNCGEGLWRRGGKGDGKWAIQESTFQQGRSWGTEN